MSCSHTDKISSYIILDYFIYSSTASRSLRPVGIWNKNSITFLWLLWVSGLCLLICIDISVPYLILKYNEEDSFYCFVAVVAINCYYGGVMSKQARELMEASETVHDVPWWCYGCTSSTRPKVRSVALWIWKWVSAKMNGINGGSESTPELAEEAARGQRAVVLWNKNWIIHMWLLLVFQIALVVCVNIIVFYLLFKYYQKSIHKVSVIMGTTNVINGFLLSEQARLLKEASETVNDVPWWCYGCTSSTLPKSRPG